MKGLTCVLCLVASGCGGQALPGGSKAVGAEPALGSEIEASAAEMERELAGLESEKKPSSDTDGDAAGADAEAPAAEEGTALPSSPPTDAPTATATNEQEIVDEDSKKRDGCKTACKALASMRRSEARICEIVGESHDKCSWAHARVKEAVQRIERAQCACKD